MTGPIIDPTTIPPPDPTGGGTIDPTDVDAQTPDYSGPPATTFSRFNVATFTPIEIGTTVAPPAAGEAVATIYPESPVYGALPIVDPATGIVDPAGDPLPALRRIISRRAFAGRLRSTEDVRALRVDAGIKADGSGPLDATDAIAVAVVNGSVLHEMICDLEDASAAPAVEALVTLGIIDAADDVGPVYPDPADYLAARVAALLADPDDAEEFVVVLA